MSITIENITKYYGKQCALDRVGFSVDNGEIVGFLGPNGAGKSTLMKILAGYLPPNSGTAKICGYNVMEQSMEARKRTGYLPENNPLYPDMYVAEYLGFIAGVHKIKSTKQRVEDIIVTTGLTPERNKKIGALSKGYRQRVGLAQALIHNPEVLILDEPTTGLDPNQIVEIRSLIRQLGKKKTVLMSTHILQEVEAICNRVIIINGGNIVADDSTGSLNHPGGCMTVSVEFSGVPDIDALKSVEGVSRVSAVDANRYLIEGVANTDIRDGVFKFAVAHDLSVLSLNKEEDNLEAAFKRLTTEG